MRALMQGKEVGSIIGKGGEIVKRFREESGARINISAGTTPERCVTITGTTDQVCEAFKLITNKLEDTNSNGVPNYSVTLRLIVPASQCGSLIGKGGAKIKEIRESTGCTIQVAKEMLPNSTDRTVTLSGNSDNISKCIRKVACVMLESPPKGASIPYQPGTPQHSTLGGLGNFGGLTGLQSRQNTANPLGNSPLAGLLRGLTNLTGAAPGAEALAALAGSQLRSGHDRGVGASGLGSGSTGTTTHEMKVPNEQIGCVIGKGGTKIAEIRQITGAIVTISKYQEGSEDAKSQERTITIKGSAEQVALAQFLINNR